MKNSQLVFIDDSGDPGFKEGASSSNFIMAAVIFPNSETAESIMHQMDEYRKSLGWKYNHEFKFTKNPKNIVKEILERANAYEYQVYAVYIEKKDFREITPQFARFLDREKLYNWLIKELLREIPIESTVKVTIDGRSSKEDKNNTKTYLRRELFNKHKTKKLKIAIQDSVRTDLLQFADLIAGSINRSLQPNKTDSEAYISIFKSKITKIRKITFR